MKITTIMSNTLNILKKDGFKYFIQTFVDDWDTLDYHIFWKNTLSLELDKAMFWHIRCQIERHWD